MKPFIFYTVPSDRLRYYFDLSITEVSLIIHSVLHELDVSINKRFINFTLEQYKYGFKTGDKKYTLIVYFSNRILSPSELAEEVKKFPKPRKEKSQGRRKI